jgi:anti-anti-sigma factor
MSTNPGGPRPFPGSITIEHEAGGRRVLRLSGDVDSVTVAEFESRQGGLPVVVDVIDAGAVSFLSSAGLAVMVRNVQSAAAAGRQPVLRAASGPVERLLQVTGMESFFPRPEAFPPATGDETPGSSDDPRPAAGRGSGGGDDSRDDRATASSSNGEDGGRG